MENKSTLTASQLFDAGQIRKAIASLNEELRSHPLDSGRRYLLAELLCFLGDWERADKQLDMLTDQDPQTMPGVILFRQLLRAAKARQQFFTEGRVPEFMEEPSPQLQYYLKAVISIREGQAQEAAELLAQAEQQRKLLQGSCNDQAFSDFLDMDDFSASILEAFTISGEYYWIPFEYITSISMQAPRRVRDLLWRPAHIVVSSESELDLFLPVIYPWPSEEEALLLGRETDWYDGKNIPVRGLGQRMFLVGDKDMPMMEIQELKFTGK